MVSFEKNIVENSQKINMTSVSLEALHKKGEFCGRHHHHSTELLFICLWAENESLPKKQQRVNSIRKNSQISC
jgi:hypothetical protein